MKRSGCENVFIGFESVNEKTLELFNKKQGVDDIIRAVEAFHARKIRIHGMFVFGSDMDDARRHQGNAVIRQKYASGVRAVPDTHSPAGYAGL